MSRELLLDTGALVTLLDRSQRNHALLVGYYEQWDGPVVTTEAVLTEATHLLARAPGGPLVCLQFVLQGGALLVPSSGSSLQRCRQLMEKYLDLPMDYADATLVALAEELDTDLVFTTDRRDFSIYRLPRGKPFEIVPPG